MISKLRIISMLIITGLAVSIDLKAANSQEDIKSSMQSFINASKPNRSVGREGHERALEFLKSELAKVQNSSTLKDKGNRIHIYEHTFNPDIQFAVDQYNKDFDEKIKPNYKSEDETYIKWKAFTDKAIQFVKKFKEIQGHNLIYEVKSKKNPNKIIYVSAHYDSITHDHDTMEFTPDEPTQGADDNASSVVALLELAKRASKEDLPQTIRFVLFDYEEIFFLGSYALAKDIKDKKITWANQKENYQGLINLEMIGWNPNKISNSVAKIYTRENSSEDLSLAKLIKKYSHKLKFEIVQNNFDRSDQWSFWQKGFFGICISHDWEKNFDEKNYHTSHDSIENINFEYLREITDNIWRALELK